MRRRGFAGLFSTLVKRHYTPHLERHARLLIGGAQLRCPRINTGSSFPREIDEPSLPTILTFLVVVQTFFSSTQLNRIWMENPLTGTYSISYSAQIMTANFDLSNFFHSAWITSEVRSWKGTKVFPNFWISSKIWIKKEVCARGYHENRFSETFDSERIIVFRKAKERKTPLLTFFTLRNGSENERDNKK